MAGTYVLLDAEFKPTILDHIDAVIVISWLKENLALLKLNQHHVAAQFQKQRFLEMTQNPTWSWKQYDYI